MDIQLDVHISEEQTLIKIGENQGEIRIIKEWKMLSDEQAICFLFKENELLDVGLAIEIQTNNKVEFDKILAVTPSWDIEVDYLEQLLVFEAQSNGIQLLNKERIESTIPRTAVKSVGEYKKTIIKILETFGYSLIPKKIKKELKSKPAKTQHRWRKEISEIEFFVQTRESKATVIWQKRNEMLLKKGATLKSEPTLNKDGSLGFAAKMGEKIRDDQQDKIKEFVTIEDIILKSVNEVGLFLYFGGTNSWLELLDSDGKSIDEWTRVD